MGEVAATMRALRKARPGPGAELQEVPVPVPGPGEVLLRIEAASICGTDLHIFDWDPAMADRVQPPLTFGHEMTGRVAATGPGAEHLGLGTRVSVETHLFDGTCATCRAGRQHICENLLILGVDVPGGFAEYIAVPAKNCWEVGAAVPPEVASIYEPFGNAVHTLFADGGASEVAGGDIAVVGCGPIGLFAVGVARAVGARRVLAVEPNEFRADLAKRMGADLVVDPRQGDPAEVVRAETGGRGVAVVAEMSGNAAAIDAATRMLAVGGRLSFLGLPTAPVTIDLLEQVIYKEARLVGVFGRQLFKTWEQTSNLLETGMVDVTPVITHRFPLEGFEEAFEAASSGRAGKVVLTP